MPPDSISPPTVWVFNAEGGRFPGGVFTHLEAAKAWIARHRLTGVLTAYPLDVGVYDWVVAAEHYTARGSETSAFVGGFTSASQPHYHFEDGVLEA